MKYLKMVALIRNRVALFINKKNVRVKYKTLLTTLVVTRNVHLQANRSPFFSDHHIHCVLYVCLVHHMAALSSDKNEVPLRFYHRFMTSKIKTKE